MNDGDWVIEFRNGRFFIDQVSDRGGTINEARHFEEKEDAEIYMKQHYWIMMNGGMVIKRPK